MTLEVEALVSLQLALTNVLQVLRAEHQLTSSTYGMAEYECTRNLGKAAGKHNRLILDPFDV